MMSIILRHMHAWMRQTPLDMSKRLLEYNPLNQRLTKAIKEQNEIGWGHALRGRLNKEWLKNQETMNKAEKKETKIRDFCKPNMPSLG